MALHVLAFAGSLRQGSYNKQLLREADQLKPAGMHFEIFDLASIPLYNQDLVTETGFPEAIQIFRNKIRAADALFIASPEYNYSITGVLKNALDWVSRPGLDGDVPPINGKPFASVGAGGRFGTVRGQMHLRQLAMTLNLIPVNKPEVYIPLNPKPPFDENGLTDTVAKDLMRQLLINLARLTLQLKTDVGI